MNKIILNTIGEVVAKKTSGGAEINNQEKTIDITENGTTEVAPDNGFTGLSKVIVNTDVKGGETGGEEGGSGGGESEGGNAFEYLDITNVTGMNGNLKVLLLQMAYMSKVPQTVTVGSVTMKQGISPASGYMYMVSSFRPGSEEFTQATNAITAISIDFSTVINMQGQVMTIQEMFAMYGAQADIDALPRITEEEFYNLNA